MSNGDIVGRVKEVNSDWYLLDTGKLVSFHTLYRDKERSDSATIYVEVDSFPGVVATKMGFNYTFMRNATREEAQATIEDKNLTVKEIITV